MADTPPDRPEMIERLQAGVAPALALLAGMQLDVFTPLAEGPATAESVAARLGVAPERLDRLLAALVTAGLLTHRGGLYANTDESAAFLVRGGPRYIGGQHELLSDLWAADMRTAASIRSGRPAAQHDFAHMTDEALAAFLRGLVPYATQTGRDVAKLFDLTIAGSVIDIGGGSGAAVAAMLADHPHLSGTLFDLPPVARVAGPILAGLPGGQRMAIEAGDILAGPPSGRYHLALLRALLQVLPPDQAALAVRHSVQALEPGGWIAITGSGILSDDGFSPPGGVYLNVTLMNFYPGGKAHRFSDHARWLAEAGCGPAEFMQLPSGAPLIRAQRL